MPDEKIKQVPKPPNDGRRYRYEGGKHVPIDEHKQQPPEPASARRAKREAKARAKAQTKAAKSGGKTASKRG